MLPKVRLIGTSRYLNTARAQDRLLLDLFPHAHSRHTAQTSQPQVVGEQVEV